MLVSCKLWILCEYTFQNHVPHSNHGLGEFGSECVELCVCRNQNPGFCILLQVLVWLQKTLLGLQILVVNLVELSGRCRIEVQDVGGLWWALGFQWGCVFGVDGCILRRRQPAGNGATMRHPNTVCTCDYQKTWKNEFSVGPLLVEKKRKWTSTALLVMWMRAHSEHLSLREWVNPIGVYQFGYCLSIYRGALS